jgi:invasion protein IalB
MLLCLGFVATGMSAAATESDLFDKSEVVFESGQWSAVCAWSSVAPETRCSVIYIGTGSEDAARLFVDDGNSFSFGSNELRGGTIRFSIDGGEPIDLSCPEHCQADGDTGQRMHQALLAGTSLTASSAALPDLYRPLTIDITPYRTAFAAVQRWHRPT